MKYIDEGYLDLTPYEALKNVETDTKFRPIVYICSPFAGDRKRNVQAARRYCRYAVDVGCIPIAPHLFFPQFMDEDTERGLAIFMGNVLLSKCYEVWVFGDNVSAGMAAEIAYAGKKGKPVRYFTEDFTKVFK